MLLTALALFTLTASVVGLGLLRFFDDQLVRQTEAELLAQGATLTEIFADTIKAPEGYGVPTEQPPQLTPDGVLEPLRPSLRAGAMVLPPPPVVSAHIEADPVAFAAGRTLEPMLSAIARRTLAGVRLVDIRGVVVASSHRAARGTSVETREEFLSALKGVPVSALRARERDSSDSAMESLSRDNAVRVVVALPVVREGRVWGVVMLVRTPMTLAKAMYGDRWQLAATLTVLLVVLALVALGVSAAVVAPLRGVLRQVRSVGLGQGVPGPIARPVVSELAELSESVSLMATRLEERSTYIRNFAASVSHEFKTPLASIRGAVELLGDDFERLKAEQRQLLVRNVAFDAERMTRLVEELLSLAKADLVEGPAAPLEVGPVLEGLARRQLGRGQDITCVLAPGVSVPMPVEAFAAAVGHLLENAHHHAGANARVELEAWRDARGVSIRVKDDGPGISAANQAKIFDAFFTTARGQGGTGLGLTIARALVRGFGGSLVCESTEGAGASFVLSWRP